MSAMKKNTWQSVKRKLGKNRFEVVTVKRKMAEANAYTQIIFPSVNKNNNFANVPECAAFYLQQHHLYLSLDKD